MPQKTLQFSLFFFRLLFPMVGSLTLGANSNLRELPEYSEYLRRLGLAKSSTSTLKLTSTQSPPVVIINKHPPLNQRHQIDTFAPIPQFPLFEICKQSPTDLYGHVICWTLLTLYLLLIASLIIYQLRSYFWLKNCRINGDGQHHNRENSKLGQPDEQNI